MTDCHLFWHPTPHHAQRQILQATIRKWRRSIFTVLSTSWCWWRTQTSINGPAAPQVCCPSIPDRLALRLPWLLSTNILLFLHSTAQTLALTLTLLSHHAVSLYSLLPQSQRTANLAAFRAHTAKVLVATDVTSRGLDIDAVAVVLNYDVPRDPAGYVHRVGRMARVGRAGLAITLVGARDVGLVQAIEERVGTRMAEWAAEGDEVVNVETRVVRDGARVLREVGVARIEALRVLASGRDENGRVRRIRKKR